MGAAEVLHDAMCKEAFSSAAAQPVAAGAAEDGVEVSVVTPTEAGAATCGHALSVAGWATLLLNAVNVVWMCVVCDQLHQYLIAPHPDDDSYSLTAVAYLIFLPSLIDSLLILALVGFILWRGYHTFWAWSRLMNSSGAKPSSGEWCCLLLVCVVLFLISCWPAGVGVYFLSDMVMDYSRSSITATSLMFALWVAVTTSFAAFATVLLWGLLQRTYD